MMFDNYVQSETESWDGSVLFENEGWMPHQTLAVAFAMASYMDQVEISISWQHTTRDKQLQTPQDVENFQMHA